MTLAEEGLLAATPGGELTHLPALPIHGPIDIVGAGDSVTANLTAALAAGATAGEAVELANAAASIVIHQLGTTGTASVQQIGETLSLAATFAPLECGDSPPLRRKGGRNKSPRAVTSLTIDKASRRFVRCYPIGWPVAGDRDAARLHPRRRNVGPPGGKFRVPDMVAIYNNRSRWLAVGRRRGRLLP